jgi:hypothetical protein
LLPYAGGSDVFAADVFFLYGFAFVGFAHQWFDVIEMVSMAI